MKSLFAKEIRAFFNSITGYFVISVFLILNGLFLWVIPGTFNMLDAGYAGIDGLFMIAPWVFMFLIPAITMRMFSDEKRLGTMEFLLTKPLTEIQIFTAKFFAALSLVLFSLLPTILYYYSIYQLGEPVGNIDSGATMGSYLGLFFLGAGYIAIGLFSSSLTDNAIISFILSAILCLIFYTGFDTIAELNIFGDFDLLIYNLGINEHYTSISRGVVDSRDLLYFFGLVVFFGMLSRLVIQSRKWDVQSRRADFIQFILITAVVVMFNAVGAYTYFRWDLTAENRYSLSDATLGLLDEIEDPMLFKVYLEGDLGADIKRLQRETRQMLDEFRSYNSNIEYQFIDPAGEGDDGEEIGQVIASRGIEPRIGEEPDGNSYRQYQFYPGTLVSYQDREAPINLLVNRMGMSPAALVNSSVQELEYNLAAGLRNLIRTERPLIGFTQGHGELSPRKIQSIAGDLSGSYNIDLFNLREFPVDTLTGEVSLLEQFRRMNRFDLLIVPKPEKTFTELDKFLLDQYIMNGGRVMWFIDPVAADMDSLSQTSEFIALPALDKLNLEDMLFHYGVRLNTNILQDFVCGRLNDGQGRSPRRWIYYPLITPKVEHPITKNLNLLKLDLASTLDTVYAPGVVKTPLLLSSNNSRTQEVPGLISLRTLFQEPIPEQFNASNLMAGVLLEGHFESIFKNRITPSTPALQGLVVKDTSRWTQQIVISDGDFISNQLNIINRRIPTGTPLPLGLDQFTGDEYGNSEFILNAVDYMLDDSGLIEVRSTREVKMRILNSLKVDEERTYWAVLNTAVPVVFVILFGLIYTWNRKRKYAIKA